MDTIVSADTLTGEPFVLRMPSHEAGLELAAARLLAGEFRVSTAEVDELLRPPQAAIMQTAEERVALHDKLVARGLQANREGAVAKAAALFWDAWRLDQRKPSTLISMLNMRLKLGHLGVVAAAYLRLLEDGSGVLGERDWEVVQTKLQQANRCLVERKERLRAALRLQRTWRQLHARGCAAALVRRAAAARVLQRCVLRSRPPPPFVEQVILLRLAAHPTAESTGDTMAVDACSGGEELRSYASTEVIASVTSRRVGSSLEPRSVAPFAALCLDTSATPAAATHAAATHAPAAAPAAALGSAALHFVVTSRDAEARHACA